MPVGLAIVAALVFQLSSAAMPPAILQIVREPVLPGSGAAYSAIEEERARAAAALGCPHPYFGLESLTGPNEGWWFNGYTSEQEKAQVAAGYAKNTRLMAVLGQTQISKDKLVGKSIEILGTYRRDLSSGRPWTPGQGGFTVITLTRSDRRIAGTVFITADGTRIVVTAEKTRKDADAARALAGPESVILAARPSWSFAG